MAVNWPQPEDVGRLAYLSHGLFIYASLVMKYIESDDDQPQDQLKDILTSTAPAGADPNDLPFAQLDAMYAHILSKVLPRNQQKVHNILNWMILGNNYNLPLEYYDKAKSLNNCDLLFGLSSGETWTLLKDLTSVIDISDAKCYEGLKFFHASFRDFLTDPSRAGSKVPGFFCPANEGHLCLAVAWITLCWI